MYRKPRTSVIDRHVLIELDGDYTDYEMGHLLRKAYQNHKAPHEYDDLKKYIRDMVIGEHNSVYQQHGNPTPVAAAAVLMPSNTLYDGSNSGGPGAPDYDAVGEIYFNYTLYIGFQLNSNCANLPGGNPAPWRLITYNNGTAIGWAPTYTTASLQTLAQSASVPFTSSNGAFYEFPSSTYLIVMQSSVESGSNYINPNYLYAAYQTSTNPLTLSTYYYWTYPTSWSAATYSYVYFGTMNTFNSDDWINPSLILTFYSTGTFSFSPGTAYITMWQWTYT